MISRYFTKGTFLILAGVLVIVITLLFLSKPKVKNYLLIENRTVLRPEDILPIDDSLVAPILYKNVTILNKLPPDLRKQRFVDVMLPGILIYRHELAVERSKVKYLMERSVRASRWSGKDSLFIQTAFMKYETNNFGELLKRMTPPPISLVLAQAALESGWGSSRFFKEANNVFGVWSFSENDDRIASEGMRDGKPIYLRKYPTLLGSIEGYHINYATSDFYSEFRDCLNRSNNVFELIWYLRMYSERRDQYVIQLRNVMVENNLLQYEDYQIDQTFIGYPPGDPK
jgi:Bax protein